MKAVCRVAVDIYRRMQDGSSEGYSELTPSQELRGSLKSNSNVISKSLERKG